MAEFRTKLITLAGIATMFAGMAHAQLNLAPCTAAAGAVFVASEGTNEQVADTVITCPAQGNAAAHNRQSQRVPLPGRHHYQCNAG